jgi:CheY-like chemotaxis protein/PAS domain-containing protein
MDSVEVAETRKVVVVGDADAADDVFTQLPAGSYELTFVTDVTDALAAVARNDAAGVYFHASHVARACELERMLENQQVLEGMPDGVVVLDRNNIIRWNNERMRQWCDRESILGMNFYSALSSPEILGPDYCPFHTAAASGKPSQSTLRANDGQYLQVHAAPIVEPNGPPKRLIVTVRDVTVEHLQEEKLNAIHEAGAKLADLSAEEVFNMELEERRELLKENILHFTKDLLNFNVMEIRMLEQHTGELVPLLSVGIEDDAAARPLFAQPQGNGVTGFVAATGRPYLCEDTTDDPLYIEGFKGAKSSITVPLLMHDQVVGTFNVESPEPRAFTDSDQQFLEIFSRDVAVAINTLELLVAQQANTAQASVEAIHSAVALPVDEILNDAVNVMERYIGHEPMVVDRLKRILENVRGIKAVIQKVGRKMTPAQAMPPGLMAEDRPKLRTARLLVVDADESVRSAAHALLERYGCTVETAHDGGEALYMVRNCNSEHEYSVVIADIRLPDMTGYDFLLKLKEHLDPAPLVLMTGFGYDPAHSIVKARQAGLQANAVLYKPFRLDQLLETVERIIDLTQ